MLLLPVFGQSAPKCHVHTLYVYFPRSPQGFPLSLHSSGVPSHDFYFYCNYCCACTVTVVILGHLNRSFYLILLTR